MRNECLMYWKYTRDYMIQNDRLFVLTKKENNCCKRQERRLRQSRKNRQKQIMNMNVMEHVICLLLLSQKETDESSGLLVTEREKTGHHLSNIFKSNKHI